MIPNHMLNKYYYKNNKQRRRSKKKRLSKKGSREGSNSIWILWRKGMIQPHLIRILKRKDSLIILSWDHHLHCLSIRKHLSCIRCYYQNHRIGRLVRIKMNGIRLIYRSPENKAWLSSSNKKSLENQNPSTSSFKSSPARSSRQSHNSLTKHVWNRSHNIKKSKLRRWWPL